MSSPILILDTASAPLTNAGDFIEAPSAPKNYTDPQKIAAYVQDKLVERTREAALDIDLARITAVGSTDGHEVIHLCRTEDEERDALRRTAITLDVRPELRIVGYNIFSFDLPLLMRRAKYLGVPFPKISTDRYKSPHTDLLLEPSDRDPSRRRSLAFYIKRLGWSDLVKPLSGEDESRVFESGRWDELRASVAHDVEAVRRLYQWWSGSC